MQPGQPTAFHCGLEENQREEHSEGGPLPGMKGREIPGRISRREYCLGALWLESHCLDWNLTLPFLTPGPDKIK